MIEDRPRTTEEWIMRAVSRGCRVVANLDEHSDWARGIRNLLSQGIIEHATDEKNINGQIVFRKRSA